MELQQVHRLVLALALPLVWIVAADVRRHICQGCRFHRLSLASKIWFVGENPIITTGKHREEGAEPEGQAGPGGTSPVKHFSRNTILFPQRLILSAITPGRIARCAGGTAARHCPEGWDPNIYSLNRSYQALAPA